MRLFTLFVGAWMLGVAVFWLIGSVVGGRVMGSGDVGAVAVYSGVIFLLSAPVIYLPVILWLRHRMPSSRDAWVLMGGVGVVYTVTAAALLLSQFGGFRPEMLMTSEALAFYVLFGTAAIVLTVGTLRS